MLGPILFLLYTQPLGDVIDRHNMSYSEFAEDTQLYDSVCPEHVPPLISRIQACVADVKEWMTEHKLLLNDGKTETLIISSQNSSSLPQSI